MLHYSMERLITDEVESKKLKGLIDQLFTDTLKGLRSMQQKRMKGTIEL